MAGKPQNMKALEKANEIRLERARLKALVAAGEVPVTTVIEHPPKCLKSSRRHNSFVTIAEVLSWQPYWGRRRAEKFLKRRKDLRMIPNAELVAISAGRRRQLARAVDSV